MESRTFYGKTEADIEIKIMAWRLATSVRIIKKHAAKRLSLETAGYKELDGLNRFSVLVEFERPTPP
jgi:hypothetical protein